MINIEKHTINHKTVFIVTLNGHVDRLFYDYYKAEQYADELFKGDV